MKSTEKRTQRQVLDYLLWKGYLYTRLNSGMTKVENRLIRLAPAGWADIIGMTKDGRFMAIECKDVKGKQNTNQKEFEKQVLAGGGVYIVARSLEDVQKAGI